VTPAAVLARHRRLVSHKWDDTAHRRPGRPPTTVTIKKLAIRMAAENEPDTPPPTTNSPPRSTHWRRPSSTGP
jgi:hypothetical protein